MQIPNLQKLLTCRNLLHDNIIRQLTDFLNHPAPEESALYRLTGDLIEKAESLHLSGNILRSYILYLLLNEKNLPAKILESSGTNLGQSLHELFYQDIMLLLPLLNTAPSHFLSLQILDDYSPHPQEDAYLSKFIQEAALHAQNGKTLTDYLLAHYKTYGCGDLALYRAFRWQESANELIGIHHFEAIALDDLIGYQRQKDMLVENTFAFLSGKPANNVLLVGARGTGKSSSVKALANKYFENGLRLLQLTKTQLTQLPQIMERLRRLSGKKFIIFLDDLSFEEYEVEYKYLKSAIEGGVEGRPENVLIYATSNRRHLIKETWKDRNDQQDELYRNDSVNETISLSDRFGVIINYLAPNQNEYLAIIEDRLRKAGIELGGEELRILGHRWEITHSGRSGRVAQQFVDHYLGTRITTEN